MISSAHHCLSQLTIERYLLGELDDAERLSVERSAASCGKCRQQLAETRADNEAFVLLPVPAGIRQMWSTPQRPLWWRPVLIGVSVATAALCVFVLLTTTLVEPEGEKSLSAFDDEARKRETRIKGPAQQAEQGRELLQPTTEVELGYFLIRDDNVSMGKEGDQRQEGDRIQFWYSSSQSGPAVIVGIDGTGTVTRYHPLGNGEPQTIPQALRRRIPSQVILDDARGVERFFLCIGELANDPEAVEAAARKVMHSGIDLRVVPRLPIDCAQASIWIEKE